jgi:hypothetical protein
MSVQTIFSRAFLVATSERAIRSFAASLASLLTASGTGLLQTDWGEKFSVAGMAALVTVLLAVGGGTFGKGEGPSFIGEEELVPATHARAASAVAPSTAAAPAPAPVTLPEQPGAPAVEQLEDERVG